MKRRLWRCTGMVIIVLVGRQGRAEDLAAAVAAGSVQAVFRGTGGSSGDVIEVSVAKTARAALGTLHLTVAPGTRLSSGDASAQSMVIAGVQGRIVDDNSYEPTQVIEASSSIPTSYLLDAYCAEFEKENPSSATSFTLQPPDPTLACILREAAPLSIEAKQAAVWIHTDHVSYGKLTAKFPTSRSDWAAAEAAVQRCAAKATAAQAPPVESQDGDGDEHVSEAAVEQLLDELARMSARDGLGFILNAEEEHGRIFARLTALGKAALPTLLRGLEASDAHRRAAAAEALSRLDVNTPELRSALRNALRLPDNNMATLLTLSLALSNLGDLEAATDGLLRLLEHPDPDGRAFAAIRLGQLGTAAAKAAPALRDCSRSDRDPLVRQLAAEAVEKITRAEHR